MSDSVEKSYGGDAHVEKAHPHMEDASALDNKAQLAQYKAAAIDAENLEHDMGVLQAVRAYPMATLWAFVMSCTIVRLLCSLATKSFSTKNRS
jgi:SP family general alpha glucoside:H+ symporter-like MFS transporter